MRDKSWFYTNQLYHNDSEESNFRDFKIRFSMYFLPPLILVIGFLSWFFSVIIGKVVDVNINNFRIVIPVSILSFILYRLVFNAFFNKISQFPIDSTNDKGYRKNKFFCITLIMIEVLLTFSIIFLLYQIKNNG